MADTLQVRKEEYDIIKDVSLQEISEEALSYQLEFMQDELKPNNNVNSLISAAQEK